MARGVGAWFALGVSTLSIHLHNLTLLIVSGVPLLIADAVGAHNCR
jgi:hypothetical protein